MIKIEDLTESQQEVIGLLKELPWEGGITPRVRVSREIYESDESDRREELAIAANGHLIEPPDAECKTCGHYDGPSVYVNYRFVWVNGRFSMKRKRRSNAPRNTYSARTAELRKIIEQGHI